MESPDRERAFQYDAFISYSHKDAELARQLQESLETRYRKLERKLKGSKRVLQICRDETDLTSAPSLWSAIEEKIRASRALIVLCSPHARSSRWVDREIRAFREAHGTTGPSIIQVVVAGEDPVEESAFPLALPRPGDVPLAIDLRRDKLASPFGFRRYLRQQGALRVLAPLLGQDYGRLSDRQGAYERRRRKWQIAAALALVLVIVAAALIARERWKRPPIVSRQITGATLQSLETDPVATLRRAIEAAEAAPTPEAEQALRSAVQGSAERRFFRHSAASWRLGSHLSQDGWRIALVQDGRASVWDLRSGRALPLETGRDEVVLDARLSADGRYAATLSRSGPIRVWETSTGRAVAMLQAPSLAEIRVAGQARHVLIESHPVGGDPVAYLWTWAENGPLRSLRDGAERVEGAGLSGDGERVITVWTRREWPASGTRRPAGGSRSSTTGQRAASPALSSWTRRAGVPSP